MANRNSINYAKSIAVPATKIDPGEINCRVKFIYDSYVYTETLDINDVILGPMLPAGAFVVDAFIHATTGGGAGKYALGHLVSASGDTVADPNAFVDECDCGGGAALQKADINDAKLFTRLTEAVQLALLISEASTGATGTVKYGVWYTLES